MMPEPSIDYSAPLKKVTFYCVWCKHTFKAEPGKVDEVPEFSHPYLYSAPCPLCQEEADQAGWEKGLMASFGKHTGPRTAEGRARSAGNLKGHPTHEESQRIRFNSLKHGMYAKTATYFPARPGAYAECEGCPYRQTVCAEQTACLKQTELFMRYHLAFEAGDPGSLIDLQAETQAMVQWIIRQIILSIVRTGVELKSPKWYFDPVGKKMHIVAFDSASMMDPDDDDDPDRPPPDITEAREIVYEYSAHPLLKTLGDFLTKNNMSLADFNMTPKVQEERELVSGFLEGQQAQAEDLLEYQRTQSQALENMTKAIERSRERRGRDPVLIEHGEDQGGG